MDPFNNLPAELRLEILIATRSKRSIKQLIQASPTMLGQYMAYKEYIDRKLLVADLDNDMVQDAMAIILFPPRNNPGHHYDPFYIPYYDHWLSSSRWRFTNPLEKKTPMNKKDQSLVKEINKLYQQMLIFIEDYLTKATAACPSREYLYLPHPGGQLTFKGRTVCTRFNLAWCNDTERRRLLRAFLRYELICKFCFSGSDKQWRGRGDSLTERLGRSEIEAISCVEIYFDSLYRAVLAQCGDSDLPESPTGILASRVHEVENYYDSWPRHEPIPEPPLYSNQMFHDRLSLNGDELCRWLACFGFDLAATLVAGTTTAGQHGRAIVGQWFKNLAKRGLRCGFDRSAFSAHMISRIIRVRIVIDMDKSYHEGPDLYEMLYNRPTDGRVRFRAGIIKCPYQRKYFEFIHREKLFMLYRSRAWAFFDDARLFKSQGEGPHFPADDVVFPTIQFHDIIGPRRDYGESQDFEEPEDFSPEIEIRNLSRAMTQTKV